MFPLQLITIENFNKEAQILIWKTIDRSKRLYTFSWSSLTSEAFKSAIK